MCLSLCRHWPPFRQGLGLQGIYSLSQFWPVYPSSQVHLQNTIIKYFIMATEMCFFRTRKYLLILETKRITSTNNEYYIIIMKQLLTLIDQSYIIFIKFKYKVRLVQLKMYIAKLYLTFSFLITQPYLLFRTYVSTTMLSLYVVDPNRIYLI